MHLRLLPWWLAAALPLPAQDGVLPVLLVSGQNNHDWRWTTPELKAALEETGRFAVTVTETPAKDLADALDNIFNHPNVGPFISKHFIRQMVTSNPTPAYVGRVAAAFNNNGTGVRGDLKAVVKAVLLDPEARRTVAVGPYYGHLKQPALYLTNILRAFNAL